MPRPRSLPPALRAVRGTVVTALLAGLVAVCVGVGASPAPVRAMVATPSPSADADLDGPAGSRAIGRSGRAGAAPTTARSVSRAATRGPVEEEDPLTVRLSRLSPGVVPERGAVRVRGTVTNNTAEEWSTVNVHAFRSTDPVTDSLSLAEAAATDPAEPVGSRITTAGTFDTIETLPPGGTVRFSLKVPREELGISGAPGAYWFGVHALGDAPSYPSDGVSDGRARTFLPLVEDSRGRRAPEVDTAVVVPVRASVQHLPDGRVAGIRTWRRLLGPDGRLRDLIDAAASADGTEVTWVVDPAVPETVAQLARGNPARSLAPDPSSAPEDGGASGDGSGSGDGGDGDNDGDSDGQGGDGTADPLEESPGAVPGSEPEQPEQLTAFQRRVAGLAADWLDDFRTRLSGESVLALPYGDLDVDAAAQHDPEWYDLATARSEEVMDGLGLEADPVLASPSGVLGPDAIAAADPGATVLLSDRAFVAPPDAPDSVVRVLDHDAVLTASGTSVGGPGPQDPTSALAVRQRLLSEAALRLLDGSRRPLTVVLPDDWHPRDADDLFPALDQPWLDAVPVSSVGSGEATEVSAEEIAYTRQDEEAQLDASSFSAASGLRTAARSLDAVLLAPSTLPQHATGEALSSLSYSDRERQQRTVSLVRAATGRLNDLLGSVRIEVPPSVTLSSQSGSLGATVVNGLDQAVRVRIDARTDGALELRDPPVLELAPESRTRVLLDVTAHRLGIHNVRLLVTDEEGRPLGASVELPIRAAQVSQVIWVIIAAGAAMLFGAIAVRLVRRVRGARSGRGAAGAVGATGATGATGGQEGSA